jgi:hypothetical protein
LPQVLLLPALLLLLLLLGRAWWARRRRCCGWLLSSLVEDLEGVRTAACDVGKWNVLCMNTA